MCRFRTGLGGHINSRSKVPLEPPPPFWEKNPAPMPVTIRVISESELLRPIFILEIQLCYKFNDKFLLIFDTQP